jgi:hypothetical protein
MIFFSPQAAILQHMNGHMTPCLITVSPDSGARQIALTRNTRRSDELLQEAGWSRVHGLWIAPADLPGRYVPPQMPVGVPLRGFFVMCLHGDQDYAVFGASERGAQMFLEQVLRWRRRSDRWHCPAHAETHER